MSKVLQTSYAKWLCAEVFVVIFFLANFILITQSAEAVTFRLPLSSDTSVHYYYDHDSSSEILDWQCGTKTYNGHRGTDFSGGPRGRNIYAAAEGTLDYKIDGFGDGFIGSTDGGGFGNYVRLDHGNGLKTYYAHMTSGSVTSKSISSNISCSEQIGGVGTSGSSSGLHLHFEPRLNGVGFDPYAGSCSGSTSWWVDQGTGSPSTTCENTSLKFNIGDTVEVFGTNGTGLKAWTDICSGTYIVKPDGATGTILQGPQFCDSYNRWEIRWTDDSSERWSAEDWLRTTTSCTYSLSLTSQSFSSSGGTDSVGVTTSSSSCNWTAVSNAGWITITSGSSGTGNGTVYYSVSANTGTSTRTGYMTIAGKTFTVTQEGQVTCTYSILPTNRSHGSGSETGSISVTTNSSSCSWQAYSNDSWITITYGSSGTGNGTVYYSVSANSSSSSRSGTITIYGASSYTFTVYQSGSCTYSLSSTSQSVGSSGGTYYVSVYTSSGCSWTATSNTNWVTITSWSSGSGNGTVSYSVSTNTSSVSRTGDLTIAGKTFTVTQNGITTTTPTPSPTPTNTSFWTGNGSIINYHGRLLSQDAGTDWPYGIEKDVTMLHTSSGKPVGFFQWQVNTSGCGNLKIDASALSSNEKKVDITVGAWSGRDQDKTFTNVQLPFTLGSSNIGTLNDGDWWVIAVAWKSNVSKDAYLDVECTDETATSVISSAGNSVILDGEYKWNGNGSVISHMFRSLANSSVTSIDWPYGVFKDVAKVHPSSQKPVVFFQWQVWDSGCKQLKLDAPDLNSDEKHVNIEVKEWSNTSPQKVFSDVTLPFTISASNSGFSMSDGQWLVIKIEFLNPVSNLSTVEASCPGF